MEFLNSLNDLSIEDFGNENNCRSDRGDRRGGQSGSILEKLAGEKRFSMITEMIEKSGGSLRDALDDPKQRVTFFAPTNEALTKFHDMVKGGKGQGGGRMKGEDQVEMPKMEDVRSLVSNPVQIIKYHTVSKEIPVESLCDGELLVTELKQRQLGDYKYQRINVNRRLGSIYLNMLTRVEESSIKACNGYVHPVGITLYTYHQTGSSYHLSTPATWP
jgi:uncharacterized surface protein with fasciclin (FAS1) repeats